MKLVNLPVDDKSDALEVLDDLRAKIESGEIKAFAAVGIAQDHTTYRWQSTTKPTTKLEILGAAVHLLSYLQQEAL